MSFVGLEGIQLGWGLLVQRLVMSAQIESPRIIEAPLVQQSVMMNVLQIIMHHLQTNVCHALQASSVNLIGVTRARKALTACSDRAEATANRVM